MYGVVAPALPGPPVICTSLTPSAVAATRADFMPAAETLKARAGVVVAFHVIVKVPPVASTAICTRSLVPPPDWYGPIMPAPAPDTILAMTVPGWRTFWLTVSTAMFGTDGA